MRWDDRKRNAKITRGSKTFLIYKQTLRWLRDSELKLIFCGFFFFAIFPPPKSKDFIILWKNQRLEKTKFGGEKVGKMLFCEWWRKWPLEKALLSGNILCNKLWFVFPTEWKKFPFQHLFFFFFLFSIFNLRWLLSLKGVSTQWNIAPECIGVQ